MVDAEWLSYCFEWLQTNKDWLFGGAGVAIVLAVFSLLKSVVRKAIHRGKNNHFDLNYMRLFGAVEVPLYMTLMSNTPGATEVEKTPDENYFIVKYGTDSRETVHRDLIDFWKENWNYAGCIPFQTELWKSLVGNKRAGINLYWNSIGAEAADLLSFASDTNVDEDASVPDDFARQLNIPYEEISKKYFGGRESDCVGFLFLLIENSSSTHLSDIVVSYRQYSNDVKIHEFIKSEAIKDKIERDRSVVLEGALTPDTMCSSTHQKRYVSSLALGNSLVWLLSAYLKDADGLPFIYLTEVSVPTKIEYIHNGRKYKKAIREPYGKKAMRLDIPNGWFGQ